MWRATLAAYKTTNQPMNEVESQQLQDLIFSLIEAEPSERQKELQSLLEDTWFGSPESIAEFVKRNEWENQSLLFLARQYIDAA